MCKALAVAAADACLPRIRATDLRLLHQRSVKQNSSAALGRANPLPSCKLFAPPTQDINDPIKLSSICRHPKNPLQIAFMPPKT
jgi:hypothetical protein